MDEREVRVGHHEWDSAIADSEGRQIIVAGPGTGKTEFLVRRVAHLIETGKARRDQIVVLCFSRRAAGDLRQRIERSIGGTGIPVDVTTFHGLALRLLETAADGVRPVPLTTPEQVDAVHRLLVSEDPTLWPITYRGILDTPAFAAEVADFLLRCSERLLTPAELGERAAERSDWRGLPELFSRYVAHLEETSRTDYGALLVSAVSLLRTAEGHELVAPYKYVLVDEYQDTSPVQAEMAALLAQDAGNLVVTGDPYQSIYSFRGAELRNVAGFNDQPDTKRIVLEQSFRVPAGILDSALRVVSSGHLPGAAGPVTPAPHEGRSEAFVFDQETAEAEWIAREVEHSILVDGISPASIAVLVRSKKELINELSRALTRRNVAHDPPDSRLVDHPAVRLFHDLAIASRLGGDPAGVSAGSTAEADRAMRRILLGPVFGVGLSQERAVLRDRHRFPRPWSQVLSDARPDLSGLIGLLADSSWCIEGSAVDGFWHAWSSLDGLDAIITDPARAEWRRAWTAFAQVLGRQSERDPDLTLARFFELSEEEDFEATPLISYQLRDERVTLTTLHQAKGLEFDVVFIANAVEGVFPDLRRGRRMLRPELLSPERTTDPQAQHVFGVQEEMRLAYTAMTRARIRVVWTATDAGVDQGEKRPSRFLIAAAGVPYELLGPPAEIQRDPVTISEAEVSLRRSLLDPEALAQERIAAADVLGNPPAPWWDPHSFPGVPEPGPDSPILGDKLRLSPSQAESYKRCPRLYALERRLRLSGSTSPWAHFGSLFHAALEKAEGEIIGTDRAHAETDRAIECLLEVWEEADFGTPELNRAWLGKAVDTLTKLYEKWPATGGKPVDLERRVELAIDGVDWVGYIDRLESGPDGSLIVDYKTSTQAMSKADAAESIQLGFYSSAVAAGGDPVADAQLWYPRTSAQTVSRRSLDMDRLEEVEEEMIRITNAIRSEDWEPTPGGHCKRCAFKLSCPAWPEGKGAYLP
ncbi:MAG: ATP-dependent DNA helicase [Actinomycetota bacterium]|nr:ATP-dependent DNA helicase [Actinomycetota bacterium]